MQIHLSQQEKKTIPRKLDDMTEYLRKLFSYYTNEKNGHSVH